MKEIKPNNEGAVVISIIITVRNGSKWMDRCFETIQQQSILTDSSQSKRNASAAKHNLLVEISVFDDYSEDNSLEKLYDWQEKFAKDNNVTMRITSNKSGRSKGGKFFNVGYGRNRAIQSSTGTYLCFHDIDDEMLSERLLKQFHLASENPEAIVGCKFERIPKNATSRFVTWANQLTESQLPLQIYTGNGPTIIMPTWMCHRHIYERVEGGFSEEGAGCPEDLIFFYRHLDKGGKVMRVDECLLRYRYHTESTTFSIKAETIWNLRLQHLVTNRLQHSPWKEGFTIWNAGKQGRRFFRYLPIVQKRQVRAFCDVDPKKIYKHYNYYDRQQRCITFRIPIVHFKEMIVPVIICMKLDLTNGEFERNLNSLHLKENQDYILFS